MKTKTTTDQQTRSLEQLLKDVDDGKIVLPEFQRDFIWPEAKSLTLFDSLFRNLFIGSLIVSKPKFSLACKSFDFRQRKTTGRKPIAREISSEEFFEKDISLILGCKCMVRNFGFHLFLRRRRTILLALFLYKYQALQKEK